MPDPANAQTQYTAARGAAAIHSNLARTDATDLPAFPQHQDSQRDGQVQRQIRGGQSRMRKVKTSASEAS